MRPLLLFDGDCGFCRRWIIRWKSLTKDKVDYEPYQSAGTQFPEIPQETFKKAVQLIEILPDGQKRITAAAEAVFRTLAYEPSLRWIFWLYSKIPGVKPACEWFYSVVASHRILFSKITAWVWGSDLRPPVYSINAFLFLRFLAVIFAIAFYSLSTQILGLAGSDGIVPADLLLKEGAKFLGANRYWALPTLFWLHPTNGFLQFLCYGGMVLSLALFAGILPGLILFLLWAFYLSLVIVGQEFLSFQWDVLLLETGFFAIFLAPVTLWEWRKPFSFNPPFLARLTLKLLLFKLMFSSGLVKLASGDPAWRNLTAMNFHYLTQPLPPWTAWYAHQCPVFFQRFSTLGMFTVELVIPFLFFMPRKIRHAGSLITMAFQMFIMLTGDYCFFNLLAMALCLMLFDDLFWHRILSKKEKACLPAGRESQARAFPLAGQCAAIFLMVAASFFEIGWIEPFRTVNSYGLFAVMTKQRDEIILEGSSDGKIWKEYEFRYKPGDPKKKPAFVQPLQPRLDWQMWFAALSDFRSNRNRWLINLCIRLLSGPSASINSLFSSNPFPEKPPLYLRAQLYAYQFSTPKEKKEQGVWWVRNPKGPYMPTMKLE